MNLPPEGLCCRCEYERCRDGDTVEVRLRVLGTVAVRLLDIEASELSEPGGPEAKVFLEDLLGENDDQLWLWLPPFKDKDRDGVLDLKEILTQTTFDRVPGVLFIGTQDVCEILVRHGYAEKVN